MPRTTDTQDERIDTHNEPDYSAVELPSQPRTEYSYVERRAELLQIIEQVGHPSAVNQTELAERYGVDQSQISRDLDRLATHVREQFDDRDRRAFVVDKVVTRAIRGLLDDEEYRKAARTAMEWDEWITEFHDLEELHAEVERLKRRRED